MLEHPTLQKLAALKLSGMLAALQEQQQMPEYQQLSFEERRKGRVTSARRMPKMPFLTSMVLTGEPSSGIGAGS